MTELLLELFSEEIPARMQLQAVEDLKHLLSEKLSQEQLSGTVETYVTPRRLTARAQNLPERQPDKTEERKGPKIGAPEKAMQGFLQSVGLREDQLEKRAEFYYAVLHHKGRPTKDVLVPILEAAIAELPWPKSMRWGAHDIRWVRPLKNILCLYNGEVLPVTFGHLKANNQTQGHRFLSPESFTVKDFTGYAENLRKAHVILDQNERRKTIKEQADRVAASHGLTVKPDEKLLEEVTGLVEWPEVLIGNIDPQFMHLPPEVLSTSMKSHQKYFSLLDKSGKLAPHFLTVANIRAKDSGKAIIHGNERVLRARLSDAKFFWEQDLKTLLESRLPELDKIIFHAKLGSVGDKVRRMGRLAKICHPGQAKRDPGSTSGTKEKEEKILKQVQDDILRAANLSKADLVTGMVGEFPDLQGTMGYYYALEQKEKPEVALSIKEHYSPLGPNDAVPTQPLSIAVSLADKIDTLVGMFAINEKPTGSKDPFALRRAALGVIRIALENKLFLPLEEIFSCAVEQHLNKIFQHVASGESNKEIMHKIKEARAQLPQDLLAFFHDRLKAMVKAQGLRHDIIDAVITGYGNDDLLLVVNKMDFLHSFLETSDGQNLLVAYRRAANIVTIEEKKDKTAYAGKPVRDALEPGKPEEAALLDALEAQGPKIQAAIANASFESALSLLAGLRAPIDAFFDRVTVNAPDKALRENRLKMLSSLRALMDSIADFSKVEG